jgi:hypothetical protein
MSLQLLEVVERARREPEGRFHSLAHLIDVSALERAYRKRRIWDVLPDLMRIG